MCDRIKERIFNYKFSLEAGKEPPKSETKTSWLNTFCFFMFGVTAFFSQEMVFTAAQDILSGRKLPTATILVCFVSPLMITKIAVPWFQEKIPYVVKAFYIALSMTLGLSLIVFVEYIRIKLVGIGLNAIATGASEMIFLALASFYPKICISAFMAGIGTASLISPLYYTGLTTWGCVSPKITMMITIPFPLSVLVSYAVLDKDFISNSSHGSPTEPKQEGYTIVRSTPDTIDQDATAHAHQKQTCGEKLKIGWKILRFIIPLFLSFSAEYLSNSSVITTIAFPNSQIFPRDHFLYYSLSYYIGKFLGRSYLFLFAWLPSDVAEFLHCDKTWIFAALEIAQLIFLLLDSLYHFVPYIWIIICFCSTLGLFAGMIAVNSPHATTQYVAPEEREFALGLLTVGNSVGVFMGGVVGLAVESYLTEHCTAHYPASKEFCFTRYHNTTGWQTNIHC